MIYGTGRHLVDLDPDRAQTALTVGHTPESNTLRLYTDSIKFWWFCELFYILAADFLKLSVGVFLHRVANKRIHIWIIRIMMFSTGLFGAIFFLLAIFQCRPISAWWIKKHSPNSKNYGFCLNNGLVVATTFASAGLNSVADWTFGILPFFIVKDLQMPKQQKRLVAAILSFANLACIATLARMPFILNLRHDDDFLWETVDIAFWSNIEPGIGIIAACAATLRPLLHSLLGARIGWFTRQSPDGYYYRPNNGKKSGSSGQSYALRESMPSLRPDYVGNYTEITAGRTIGEKDLGKELYSRSNSRNENVHLTPAAATPANSSPPGATSAMGKIEIQKSVEFTFTETVEAVEDSGLGIRRDPSFTGERDYPLRDHFGPEPSASYYPSHLYKSAHDDSASRPQNTRTSTNTSPRQSAPKKTSPQISMHRSQSAGPAGDPFNRW